MGILGQLNITQQSKTEFFDVMDNTIDVWHNNRRNKRCYLEQVRKAMGVVLYEGLTPEMAARCYRVHIFVQSTRSSGKFGGKGSKQKKSFFSSSARGAGGGGGGSGGGGGGGSNTAGRTATRSVSKWGRYSRSHSCGGARSRRCPRRAR